MYSKPIQELLTKRNLLADIAEELYGEIWIAHNKFWGSPTELEMRELNSQLIDLGYTEPEDMDDYIDDDNDDEVLPRWWEEDDQE